MIDLSIIIVNWNVADLLAKCIKSIEASNIVLNTQEAGKYSVEVIVVDSASKDHSVAMLRQDFPKVRLLVQKENVGFTQGNNIGLEVAKGRYILLLNPDTEMIGDALPKMIRYLDENPKVGILGPHTLNTDGTTQSSRRRFPGKMLAFFESTWLQSYTPRSMLASYYVEGFPDDTILEVDWVQGSALMTRREVYDEIGGLDTGFTMYFEELDWCKRAKDIGWEVIYLGTAQIIHHGGKSTDQIAAHKHIYFQTSKIRYFYKYYGSLFATILRAFLLISYAWQIIIEGLKGILGYKSRTMRWERISNYWQVIRSGLRES